MDFKIFLYFSQKDSSLVHNSEHKAQITNWVRELPYAVTSSNDIWDEFESSTRRSKALKTDEIDSRYYLNGFDKI